MSFAHINVNPELRQISHYLHLPKWSCQLLSQLWHLTGLKEKTINDLKCSYTFALYQIKCKTRSSMCDTAILNYSSNFSNLLPNTKITEFPKCLFLKLNQKMKSFCTVYQHYEKQHLLSGYFQNSHKAVLYF